MGHTWEDKVTNNNILCKARSTSIYAMLSERRATLAWTRLPNVQRTHLQGPTVWSVGVWHKIHSRPQLRFKDSCKRDLLSAHMDINTWEGIVVDRPSWRHEVKQGIDIAEQDRREQKDLRRQRRKESSSSSKEDTIHVCNKDCQSRIGIPPAIERVSGLSSNQDTVRKAAPTYNHGLRSAGYNCTMK
ncbi:hypothetical protein BSL78_28135 [Apostichopus japonicus]|uniref:Uncharacterized protein n=1 Tax=Stichopus japonicus TaxID=307972 RepID=A0A2G8JH58_STIJA|nr:hypothetical protein BSL78_28135 [Apostichopus japonicus]